MALNGRRYLGACRDPFGRTRCGTVRSRARRRSGPVGLGGEPSELSCVVEGRKGEIGRSDVERLLRDCGFDIVGVTPGQAEIAVDALRRFGRGHHRARLNIGDRFSYALAIATGHSLLFKGDDFIHTDIRPALAPELAAP